jgi:hypothetical protein
MRRSGRYRQRLTAKQAQPEGALTAVTGGDVEFSLSCHTVASPIKKTALPRLLLRCWCGGHFVRYKHLF